MPPLCESLCLGGAFIIISQCAKTESSGLTQPTTHLRWGVGSEHSGHHLCPLKKTEAQEYRAYSLVLMFDHQNISVDRIYLNLCVCVCVYTYTQTCHVVCLIMCGIDVINMGSETSGKGGAETWENNPKEKSMEMLEKSRLL